MSAVIALKDVGECRGANPRGLADGAFLGGNSCGRDGFAGTHDPAAFFSVHTDLAEDGFAIAFDRDAFGGLAASATLAQDEFVFASVDAAGHLAGHELGG